VSFSPPFAPLASTAWQLIAQQSTRGGMALADCGVYKDIFKVRFRTQDFEKSVPNSGQCSTAKPTMRRAPVAQLGRPPLVHVNMHCPAMDRAKVRPFAPATGWHPRKACCRPRSGLDRPFLPGRKASIRAHCASVRVRLLKITFFFDLESELDQFGNSPKEDAA